MQLKSVDGMYLGTVLGSTSERANLAAAVRQFFDSVDKRLCRRGVYSQVQLEVIIRDGRLYAVENTSKDSHKTGSASE